MIADLFFDECNLKRPMKNSLKRQTLMGQTEQYHSNGSVFNRYAYGLESKCNGVQGFHEAGEAQVCPARESWARDRVGPARLSLTISLEAQTMPAMARPPAAQGLRHH